jgi:hypothetical protein
MLQGAKTKGKRTRDGKSEDALKKARKLNQLGAGTIQSARSVLALYSD